MTFRSRRAEAWRSYIQTLLSDGQTPDPQTPTAEEEILRLTKLARDHGLVRDHVSHDHVPATSTNLDEAKDGGISSVAPAVEVDRLVHLARSENLSGRFGPLFRNQS